MATNVETSSAPPFATLAGLLFWLQVVAVTLLAGLAALLTIAVTRHGGLNFYPFDPDGPGLIDPKNVLPELGFVDDLVALPAILYGWAGVFPSVGLAALGGAALAVGSVRGELSGRRRVAVAICSALLAAHAIVMLFTPFGADLTTWLLD